MNETWELEPNAQLAIIVNNGDWGRTLAEVKLTGEGNIIGASPELLRDSDPNVLLSMGDGSYLIGVYKMTLIVPRPRHAIFTNIEMFYVTIEKPEGINV